MITTNLFLAQPNFGYERSRYRSGNLSLATSPRWDMSSVSAISPGSLCGHNINSNCQDEVKSNHYLRPGMCKIKFAVILINCNVWICFILYRFTITHEFLHEDESQYRSGSYSFSRQRSYCGYEATTTKYNQGNTNRSFNK